jgi:hypothetical protein
MRTASGPTPFVYRYRFDSDEATVVHLAAKVELYKPMSFRTENRHLLESRT